MTFTRILMKKSTGDRYDTFGSVRADALGRAHIRALNSARSTEWHEGKSTFFLSLFL